MKNRLFSGMQPTGELHLGNYVGALKNWVSLLDEFECIFCIVDYHAITVPYDRDIMKQRCLNAAVDYIAGGLDPEKCTIFIQSHVPQHTELSWVFNSVTPLGQLMRMTQFKAKTSQFADKADDGEDYSDIDERSSFLAQAGKVNSGLFTYPVLQASDILLYKAIAVPVGEDQVQHVELTRDIARRFNHRFGKQIFPECKPLLSEASRVMGLDAVNKMSKSIGNHIPMSMSKKDMVTKITKEAVSDSRRVKLEDPGVPEECNVYSWHRIFSSAEDQQWAHEGCTTAGIGCFKCKKKVAANIADTLEPYREKREELLKRPDYLMDILRDGALRCRKTAEETMSEVRDALGLTDI